jgi:hypothetical protein
VVALIRRRSGDRHFKCSAASAASDSFNACEVLGIFVYIDNKVQHGHIAQIESMSAVKTFIGAPEG